MDAYHRGVAFLLSDNPIRLNFAYLASSSYSDKQWSANYDLTTWRARAFNAWNLPALPFTFTASGKSTRVRYFAFAAEANVDGSQFPLPLLDAQEARGLGIPALLASYVGSLVYRMQGEVQSVSVERLQNNRFIARENPSLYFQPNDVAVPLWSALGAGLRFVSQHFVSQQPTLQRNHATLADPVVALNSTLFGRLSHLPCRSDETGVVGYTHPADGPPRLLPRSR